MRAHSFIAVVLPALLLGACASTSTKPEPAATAKTAEKPVPAAAPVPVTVTPAQARGLPIVRGDGAAASWDELVLAAAHAEAVLIGESHGHPMGLPAAAALFEDILARAPRAALALEFFERDEQAAVNDYLAGLIDTKTFKERTRRTASSYPAGHEQMLEAARAAARPVIAANSPRVYVRAARREGYERLRGLTPEQTRLFRIPDELPTGRYRADFDAVMGQPGALHGLPENATPEQKQEAKDAMFRSQSVWDWTMADSVARLLDDGSGPAVLVVGQFHIEHEGGLVSALRAIRPGTRVLTVTFAGEDAGPLDESTRGRADFVVFTGAAKP